VRVAADEAGRDVLIKERHDGQSATVDSRKRCV